MKKFQNNKGFTLIELIVVIAIIAILAAVAVPSYQRIQDRAERAAAISNASTIVSCLNAHNALVATDPDLVLINGTAAAQGVTLAAQEDPVVPITTQILFNTYCENDISGMGDADTFDTALEYIIILTGPDEFGVDETYDHTES